MGCYHLHARAESSLLAIQWIRGGSRVIMSVLVASTTGDHDILSETSLVVR